jgi:hypothetical protein
MNLRERSPDFRATGIPPFPCTTDGAKPHLPVRILCFLNVLMLNCGQSQRARSCQHAQCPQSQAAGFGGKPAVRMTACHQRRAEWVRLLSYSV